MSNHEPSRRNALQTMGAAIAVPALGASGCATTAIETLSRAADDVAPAVLHRLENEILAVTLYVDASVEIVEKRTGQRWSMGRLALQNQGRLYSGDVWPRSTRTFPETYAGRFRVRLENGLCHYTLFNRDREAVGRFVCRISLVGGDLRVELLEIDKNLPNLTFPPPIESESLLFPRGIGQWLRQPMSDIKFWTYFNHLNMRWFGGLRGEHGWLAIIDQGVEDAGIMATGMTASPGWMQSLDTWSGAHSVRYRFIQGGHVGAAREFRRWAIGNGLHHPLAEKVKRTPALANLFGGRVLSFMQASMNDPVQDEELLRRVGRDGKNPRKLDVWFTHADVRRLIAEAQAAGMKRGGVLLEGWLPGGYDWQYPDVWPPEPALGTVEEMKQLCATPDPFVVGVQDNYQDIYRQSPSWPHGVNRRRDGSPMAGGYWRGGQAYILNSRNSLQYARRNWKDLSTLGARMAYVDTITAVALYESWEKGNSQTRQQDMQGKQDLLRLWKERNVVLSSEEGADFGVPWIDWFWCRHEHKPGQSVPLWPLVFHDAVVMSRIQPHFDNFFSRANNKAPEGPAPFWLPDLLWGYMMGENAPVSSHWDTKTFQASLPVDRLMERIATADMVDHHILSDDGMVEKTRFVMGDAAVEVLANFSSDARSVDGATLPGGGHLIRDA